jgi:DNA-binding MarR family transcriptional regulator
MMARDDDPIDFEVIANVDRLVHEPGRLMVLACLAVVTRADYLYVLRQTGLTQGNLSSHLAKLEAAGYVAVEKTFVGRMPRTLLQLTDKGRDALRGYREKLVNVLKWLPE